MLMSMLSIVWMKMLATSIFHSQPRVCVSSAWHLTWAVVFERVAGAWMQVLAIHSTIKADRKQQCNFVQKSGPCYMCRVMDLLLVGCAACLPESVLTCCRTSPGLCVADAPKECECGCRGTDMLQRTIGNSTYPQQICAAGTSSF
eukprot:1853123-Amphidinium_carterae.1